MFCIVIFRWDKSLETGIPLLDGQHKHLLTEINSLMLRQKCNSAPEDVRQVLDFLRQFVQYHFQTEEAFHLNSHYPKYREHQALHNSLRIEVKRFDLRLAAADYSGELVSEFCDFLRNWVTNHIRQHDFEFAEYYKSHLED